MLYTGDIRSEPWFVDSLSRSPFLLEYTTGLKTLDCIYLDTSNTENMTFPTQADGLKELVQKVLEYPLDTVFHFNSWTYGYENVWLALSKALKSRVSVSMAESCSFAKKADTYRPLQAPDLRFTQRKIGWESPPSGFFRFS